MTLEFIKLMLQFFIKTDVILYEANVMRICYKTLGIPLNFGTIYGIKRLTCVVNMSVILKKNEELISGSITCRGVEQSGSSSGS